MSWEVSGIGTEVIGLLWPFLECFTGSLFLELFISFIVPSWPLLFSHSCFLPVVSVSNTQGKTPLVPGSTIALVSNTGSTYAARWFG